MFFIIVFVAQVFLGLICAFNLIPTNTEESRLDRLVVSLLWLSLSIENLPRFLESLPTTG